jgi:hypothetical protein
MIKENTVLILGAGASKPYNFPLGGELRDEVIKITTNAEGLEPFALLKDTEFDFEYLKKFTIDLSVSGFSSVDAFLEERIQWADIGKLAMAHKLIVYEINAKLFPPNQPKDHWYETLWHKLKAPTWQKFKQNKLHIITFNYDRSLEHYLSTIISNNYNVRKDTILKYLPIIHVHGDLGPYENFGEHSPPIIKKAAESIKIVHESDNSSVEFRLADRVLNKAKTILFIGFGYHPQNMNKFKMFKSPIKYVDRTGKHHKVLGTHKGYKSKAWERIFNQYNFYYTTKGQGGGTISEFILEWIKSSP